MNYMNFALKNESFFRVCVFPLQEELNNLFQSGPSTSAGYAAATPHHHPPPHPAQQLQQMQQQLQQLQQHPAMTATMIPASCELQYNIFKTKCSIIMQKKTATVGTENPSWYVIVWFDFLIERKKYLLCSLSSRRQRPSPERIADEAKILIQWA